MASDVKKNYLYTARMFDNIFLFSDDLCVVNDQQEFEGSNLMMCPEHHKTTADAHNFIIPVIQMFNFNVLAVCSPFESCTGELDHF